MKNILITFFAFFAVSVVLSAQSSDAVLMQINGKPVYLSEFEYIYTKNNTANMVDKKSLDEYVDLFINFKLKVEEALAQGLDTTSTFNSEFGTYKNQLAEQYLTDEKALEKLVQEAYDRKKYEVEVRHIVVRIPDPGTSADTLAAYNKALEYYNRAQKENFEELAQAVSDDPSAKQNGGYVGWIPVLRTPYSFESMAYNTAVGSVSMPVRTFIGYHIIQVMNKRPSAGEVKVAHIFLLNDRNDQSKAPELKQRIDSIYNEVLAGKDFGELATKLSQDPGSASQNGELPWFGTGQMVPEFERTAFSLKEKGDVSMPIQSQYGWHIVKLIDKKPIASFSELKETLTSQVKQNDRGRLVEKSFFNNLKNEYAYSLAPNALADYYTLADQYLPTDSAFKASVMKLQGPLAKFATITVTKDEFSHFLVSNQLSRGVRPDIINNAYEQFINKKLKEYEISRLDDKYADFRNLVQEYHDGILLFDVMNREVWDKASKDTDGLKQYFDANKKKYAWNTPHYKGRVVYVKDEPTLTAAKNIIKYAAKDSVDKFLLRLNDSIRYVKTEKGLWVKGENAAVDQIVFNKKEYKSSDSYPYCFVQGKILKKYPEEFGDVRGLVTADYQDYLEKKWITYLRQKYPVVIDEKVLKTVKKN